MSVSRSHCTASYAISTAASLFECGCSESSPNIESCSAGRQIAGQAAGGGLREKSRARGVLHSLPLPPLLPQHTHQPGASTPLPPPPHLHGVQQLCDILRHPLRVCLEGQPHEGLVAVPHQRRRVFGLQLGQESPRHVCCDYTNTLGLSGRAHRRGSGCLGWVTGDLRQERRWRRARGGDLLRHCGRRAARLRSPEALWACVETWATKVLAAAQRQPRLRAVQLCACCYLLSTYDRRHTHPGCVLSRRLGGDLVLGRRLAGLLAWASLPVSVGAVGMVCGMAASSDRQGECELHDSPNSAAPPAGTASSLAHRDDVRQCGLLPRRSDSPK